MALGKVALVAIWVSAFATLACGDDGAERQRPEPVPDPAERCTDYDALKKPLFGDTHVHTALSLDANLLGTRTSQADAYGFARGQAVGLSPYDEDGTPMRMYQMERPLDFVAMSDHAEFLGVVSVCQDPSSDAYETEGCVEYRTDPDAFIVFAAQIAQLPDQVEYPELCGGRARACIAAGERVWEGVVDSAEAAYDRTDACEFTTFVGYEWSAAPEIRNLHRNVIFKNEAVPFQAQGYADQPYVEDLWAALRDDCIDAGYGCDVLTIPHNSNLARGSFFENAMKNGAPFDAEYAAERKFMEPIIEIMQHKGNSECLDGEPVVDEMCQTEVLPYNSLGDVNQLTRTPPIAADYVRNAYGEGMKLADSLGSNPFEHGIVAATDTHISAPGGVSEYAFPGHSGAGQNNRDMIPDRFADDPYLNPGGLTAVWAEENARPAIFEAMRRKETFGTSGPRIVPRFFGGWTYPDTLCESTSFAQTGYDDGVPMGGTLSAQPMAGTAPKFAVSAAQDVGTTAEPGTPLQRIQIIKGWIENREYEIAIYDVAGDAGNGATVDLTDCSQSGPGSSTLCAVWEDPDFDPSERAYYYARVVENPSCRWTTRRCLDANYDCEGASPRPVDEACCDPVAGLNRDQCAAVDCNANPTGDAARCCLPAVQPSIQELAWTSPIWYHPPQ